MAKKAVEQTGLIPRSIIRTFDRFRKQLFPEAENLIIQEFRISRYQFLVSIKCLVNLIFIPLIVNYLLKNFLLIPLTENFWNNKQSEIFLNSYQQQQAFNELKKFQEKLYFEYLLSNQVEFPFKTKVEKPTKIPYLPLKFKCFTNLFKNTKQFPKISITYSALPNFSNISTKICLTKLATLEKNLNINKCVFQTYLPLNFLQELKICLFDNQIPNSNFYFLENRNLNQLNIENVPLIHVRDFKLKKLNNVTIIFKKLKTNLFDMYFIKDINNNKDFVFWQNLDKKFCKKFFKQFKPNNLNQNLRSKTLHMNHLSFAYQPSEQVPSMISPNYINDNFLNLRPKNLSTNSETYRRFLFKLNFDRKSIQILNLNFYYNSINTILLNSTDQISEHTIKKLIKNKIVELAIYYNHQSILALTNLVGDFITFLVLSLVIMSMKPEISILKSFLTESIYSLNDTKKSFLLILGTDLLVGFHSPRGWEICLQLLLRHFGFPENKDFVFLFVASFPVVLDTVFKYWIFRYLNKISPSTVATYHNMIE